MGKALSGELSFKEQVLFVCQDECTGRAVALPLMLAVAKCLSFYVKIFYVMGKVLIGAFLYEDRSCCMHSVFQNYDSNTQSGLMLQFCHLHGV